MSNKELLIPKILYTPHCNFKLILGNGDEQDIDDEEEQNDVRDNVEDDEENDEEDSTA